MDCPPQSNPDVLAETYPDLWELVKAERIAMYEGTGATRDEATVYEPHRDESQYLLGECPMNATELGSRLLENGYEPVLVLGALDFGRETESVTETLRSVRATVEGSFFHTWIELDTNDEQLVLEVATEWSRAPGLPYISTERPPEYRVPENGRFVFEPWMTYENVGVPSRIDEFLGRATPVSK
jgi:hypothetical protein